jgi:hypothetical protein
MAKIDESVWLNAKPEAVTPFAIGCDRVYDPR